MRRDEDGLLNHWGAYDRWVESQKLPVHGGYYVEDLRTLELGDWPARGCRGAFLELEGQAGFTETCVVEIARGGTTLPHRMLLNEVVYVIEGRGVTTVKSEEGKPEKTFEWQKHSMFLIPGNCSYQLSNARGDRPARLLHCNHLPNVMAIIQEPEFFFNHPPLDHRVLEGEGGESFYSEAKVIRSPALGGRPERKIWTGNFFPDMKAWDRLDPFKGRGRLVPPAFQYRRGACPLPGDPTGAPRSQRPGGKDPEPRTGPDRVSERRALDPAEVRSGAGQERNHVAHAGGSLPGPELRVEV
jgi:mannose-6-phosphate isomerase-like protein (cupin superfamily)